MILTNQIGLATLILAASISSMADVKFSTKLGTHTVTHEVLDTQYGIGSSPISQFYEELVGAGKAVTKKSLQSTSSPDSYEYSISLGDGVALIKYADFGLEFFSLRLKLGSMFNSVFQENPGDRHVQIRSQSAKNLRRALEYLGKLERNGRISLEGSREDMSYIGELPGAADIICATKKPLCILVNNPKKR